MAQNRRMGAEDSEVRTRFIDAAEQVLGEDGAHKISARRVAAQAGLKTQLLYYYFRTMDDLVLAVVRRVNGRRTARFEEAMAAPDPLRALWELNIDASSAKLAAEMSAIAFHREEVRAEIIESATEFRKKLTEAVRDVILKKTGEEAAADASGMVMIAAALARTIVNESTLGLTEGHEEAFQIVEKMLKKLG